jgi:calcium-dependent protein kinase
VPLRHYEVIDEMHDNAEAQFDDLDKDKSGYIELEELWADLQKRGMTEVTREMVEEVFKKLDANGDGKVSMAEFKTSLGVPLREYEIEEQMHEDAEAAFAKMDKDGDGFISMEEIEADLKRLGMESVDKCEFSLSPHLLTTIHTSRLPSS